MKIILVFLFLIQSIFANDYLESIYDNIVLNDVKKSITSVKNIQKSIENNNFKIAKEEFTDVVKTWKSVQAFYFLGDLNSDYLDQPRYMDTFHHGNEDIKKQLDLIISNNDDLSYAIYKNSHKTINALEYILFKKDLTNKRVQDISLIITKSMITHLNTIFNGYKEKKNEFIKDEQKANAIMLNALIENSYKLKEWRIGDAAGLSRKHRKDPDNSRAEYYISKNSANAIKAIIDTHLRILDKQDFKNYGSLISSYDVKEELDDAVKYLKDAKSNLKYIINDDFSKAKPLYKSAKKIHATYYITLIGKLKVTAKVLDADGD